MLNKSYILHHTHEGRVGICSEDDPNPPAADKVIATLSFDQVIGLYDDIHESMIFSITHFEPDDSPE